jgi:hypothetical protein
LNPWLEALGERLAAAAAARGARIDPPVLGGDTARELLDLARVSAHTQERRLAPLAAFLAGVAAERMRAAGGEVSDAALAGLLREVREELEAEAPPTIA